MLQSWTKMLRKMDVKIKLLKALATTNTPPPPPPPKKTMYKSRWIISDLD